MEKQIIFDFYNTIYSPKTGKLFPGFSTLLKALKREYRLNLVTTLTNGKKDLIDALGLDIFFSKIVFCKTKTKKIFKNLANQAKVTYVIGDRLEEEISIGQSLKLPTLRVNPKLKNPCSAIKKFLEANNR